MSTITTHVLDTSRGRPAAGLAVELCRVDIAGAVTEIATAVTDFDGRVGNFADAESVDPGTYRLTFHTTEYFAGCNCATFYPKVDISFEIKLSDQHYHVPLLLSPFGYSTYRGS